MNAHCVCLVGVKYSVRCNNEGLKWGGGGEEEEDEKKGRWGGFKIEHPLESLAEPRVAMGRFCSSFNHKFLRNSCITCILNSI